MNPFLDLKNIQSFKQKPATFGLGWCVFIFDAFIWLRFNALNLFLFRNISNKISILIY